MKKIASLLVALLLALSLFGCGNSNNDADKNSSEGSKNIEISESKNKVPIFWYLTDNGRTLHLSGTKPEDPNYVDGNDDFIKQKYNGKTNGYYVQEIEGKRWFYYENDESNKLLAPDFFNSPIYNASKIVIDNTITPSAINFSNLDTIIEIENLNYINTKNLTSMNAMFSGCTLLKTVDMSRFNTKNVTGMNAMFSGCKSLQKVDVSCFDTSNVKDMSYMFSGCNSIAELVLNNFDTSNVEKMYGMFEECNSLKYLDISSFDTTKVIKMQMMFYKCFNLKDINIMNFNTLNVDDMSSMFKSCNKLEVMDLSNFIFNKNLKFSGMFSGCNNLRTIYTSENMYKDKKYISVFASDDKLTGENGTRISDWDYLKSSEDGILAIIDSNEEKGLLTFKKSNLALVKGQNKVVLKDGMYYINSNKLVDSWVEYGNYKYYLDSDGKPVINQWVDNHYLGEDGRMYTNKKTPDGKQVDNMGQVIDINSDLNNSLSIKNAKPDTWYVTNSGIWYFFENDRTTKKKGWYVDPQDNQTYYLFPDTGIMAVGWNEINGDYYYFSEQHNANPNWYYLDYSDTWKSYGNNVKSYGSMFRDEITPDGKSVDSDGRLIKQ